MKQNADNAILFMESQDYIRLDGESTVSSRELYTVYCMRCEENGFTPMKTRSFSDYLSVNAAKLGIEHMNNVYNADGRRVWGYRGINPLASPGLFGRNGIIAYHDDDCPFGNRGE